MNQTKFTFESENLTVDWISFKFQKLEDSRHSKLANYLFMLGFNSYQQSGKLARPIKEPIYIISNNKYEVLFVKEGPYWSGTIVQFSGKNAALFYNLIQKQIIDWKLFDSAVMNRFDIYFFRPHNKKDDVSVKQFFEKCQQKFELRNKNNYNFEKNSKGLLFSIGSRRSNNFLRIYESTNSLKFEYELKGKLIQKSHLLLIENRLYEFENQVSSYFLTYFGKLLPLNYSSTDWLSVKLRPIRKQKSFQPFFQYTKAKDLCKNRQHLQEMVMEVPSWKNQCNDSLLRPQE
jgi:hypothetical protein